MKKPFTQLENETMEALARAPLTAREFRVMLAVIRLTNGFHLTATKVPLKDLLQLTGLARNHLHATVKRLSQCQLVVYEEGLIACHGPALCLPHSPDTQMGNELKCPWCGRGHPRLPHHYPIPRSQGGKQTVTICGRCHRLYHLRFFINASAAKTPEEYEECIRHKLWPLLHEAFPLLTEIVSPPFYVLNPPWMWQLPKWRRG